MGRRRRITEVLSRSVDTLLGRKSWQRRDGVYTWRGYGWGIDTPPRTLAYQYFNATLLRRAVGERRFRRSLEVGCGWGARTPWIAELAEEAHAIEPNGEALTDARAWFPRVTFHEAKAQSIPYPDQHFDLIVLWSVLQHIPPDAIVAATEEIGRVLSPDGLLLLFETTSERRSKPPTWRRPLSDYEALFASLRSTRVLPRSDVSGREEEMALMLFEPQPVGGEPSPSAR